MWYIIIPQAFKNVLPALANEFIVLLKETAVAGYIGLADLTYAATLSVEPALCISTRFLALPLFTW
jgi:ABC-type amino acid transport system permease subunit